MRGFGALIVLGLLVLSFAPPSNLPQTALLIQRLDELIPLSLNATRTAGVVVALVREGEIIWVQGYGYADRAEATPMTPQRLFGVASISKSVTAWGVMSLVERGLLDLDAPVNTYLHRWQLRSETAAGVTARRLLSHSAGLNTPEYLGYLPHEALPTVEHVLAEGNGRASGVRIVATPGKQFAYSDGGYLILQLLIEEISGQPFGEYMEKTVLRPLGMAESCFCWGPDVEARLVTSYDEFGRPLPHYQFVELAPAGLYTTAGDLARFVAAGMAGPNGEAPGRGVLRAETVATMLAPAVPITGAERLIYAQAYGLGYFVETLSGDLILVSHMGANLNGVTEFAALPERGEGIVVLTNNLAGHEVFADVLHAWTKWLGVGQATLPRAIRVARQLLQAGAASLAVAALLWFIRLGESLRCHTRRLRLLPPERNALRGKALRLGLPLLGLLLVWRGLYPALLLAMPSVARFFAGGGIALCMAALAWGASEAAPQAATPGNGKVLPALLEEGLAVIPGENREHHL